MLNPPVDVCDWEFLNVPKVTQGPGARTGAGISPLALAPEGQCGASFSDLDALT